MDYTIVRVTDSASDSLTAYDEVVEYEATETDISDATARTIAGWYVQTPVMGEFASGVAVRLMALVYAVGDMTHAYLSYPDEWSKGDVLNLNALDSWCDAKRAITVLPL